MDIFNFESKLKFVIIVWGSITTLSPFILNKLNVPDEFLKYYILFVLATFIGALGTFNGIGIYILFVLAPTVSCLYFDPKLTRICSTFSYFVMVASVYVNAAGKMEVKYRNWTHFQTFRAYIIGFTIDFVAQILDELKYAKNLREGLFHALEQICNFFDLDRIAVLETDLTDGTNTLKFQWSKLEENTLNNFFQYMDSEEIKKIIETYDRNGYVEYNPQHDIYTTDKTLDAVYKNHLKRSMLGTQLLLDC